MNLISYDFGVSSGSANPNFITSKLAGGTFSPASFVVNGGGFALGTDNLFTTSFEADFSVDTGSAIKVSDLSFDVDCQEYSNLKFYINDKLYLDLDINQESNYTLNIDEVIEEDWFEVNNTFRFDFTVPLSGYAFNPIAPNDFIINNVVHPDSGFTSTGDDITFSSTAPTSVDDPYFSVVTNGADIDYTAIDYAQNTGIDNLFLNGEVFTGGDSGVLYNGITRYNAAAVFAGPTPPTGPHIINGDSQLKQLYGVSSISDNFSVDLFDLLQFGQLAPFARVPLTTPTVGFEISYYACDGINEERIGFNVDATKPMLADILDRSEDGRNYFIGFAPNGYDMVEFPLRELMRTVGLGNCFITNYSLNASLGDFVQTTINYEAFNYVTYNKGYGQIPTVDTETGEWNTNEDFQLPIATTYDSRPLNRGDIQISFNEAFTKLGERLVLDDGFSNNMNIQSLTLDVPITRTGLDRIGSTYSFSKEPDFPIRATLTLEVLSKELNNGSILDLLNSCALYKLGAVISFYQCGIFRSSYSLRGLRLDSESSQLSTTNSKTSTLNFSLVIGGVDDVENNIYYTKQSDLINASSINVLASDGDVLASND